MSDRSGELGVPPTGCRPLETRGIDPEAAAAAALRAYDTVLHADGQGILEPLLSVARLDPARAIALK